MNCFASVREMARSFASLKALIPYITPKLIVFAVLRICGVTCSGATPKINDAVER